MKSLLVLSPRLPPYNGADAQRVRTMLPHLAAHGWRATVLAASDDAEAGARDEALLATLPANDDVEIVRVRPWPARTAARFGLRQHMLRAYAPWRRALAAVQRRRRFDAVFVSHTDFALWPLALRCEAPVVLDWQDPWWSDYHRAHPDVAPPGGRFRYGVMQAIARRYEPRVARAAAAHVVVSPAYEAMLRGRYPDLPADAFTTLPFAASADDRARALATPSAADEWPTTRARWWVYAGRGGADLHFALSALFIALRDARAREPARYADLGLLFVGTAYDARDTARGIAALAGQHGVGDLVEERPRRIGLLAMYRLLERAEALLMPGSDDPAYVASKLAPCLLGGQPLLGIFHAASSAHVLARAHDATRFVSFAATDEAARAALVRAIDAQWLAPGVPARARDVALGTLEAGAMTARLAALFDRVARR